MLRLEKSVHAWATPDFAQVFRQEIAQLDIAALPLQQGLSFSSQVMNRPIQAMILSINEAPNNIHVKAGIFYTGVIAGCSCADDPTPVAEQNEYCVLQFCLDKKTSESTVTLVAE